MKHRYLLTGSVLFLGVILCLLAIGLFQNNKPKGTETTTKVNLKQRESIRAKKSDNPGGFAEFQEGIRTKDGLSQSTYKPNYKINEMVKAGILNTDGSSRLNPGGTSLRKTSSALSWVERGPANVGGRTRGVIIDPNDATSNTWFAASVSGGIWKTTNAGASWVNKTPDIPNLATTSLAIAASQPDIMYAGTGEFFVFYSYVAGDGIFKSTNHGETWSQLPSTVANTHFKYVNRVIVSPTDEDLVLAVTNDGIHRSTNGGTDWTQVYSSANAVQHIVANPLNFNTLYASVNSFGVVKSYDGGVTWINAKSGIGSVGRLELAVTPIDTNRIFVAAEVSDSECQLYLSDDGAANWLIAKDTAATVRNWLEAQGNYDNTIVVHPYSKDTVFVGGVVMLKIGLSPGVSTTLTRYVDTVGTASFLDFIFSTGPYLGGGVFSGNDFFAGVLNPTNVLASDTTFDIEIRFGPGITQKAHRFLFAPNFAYRYQDYVEVPFQVWDVTNNRQLMASFRDRDSNGVWDLFTYTGDPNNVPRDYLIVNAVPYSTTADPNIAVNSGEVYKCIMVAWLQLKSGATWTPNNLPTSKLIFNAWDITNSRIQRSVTLANPYNFPPYNTKYGVVNPGVHVDHHNLLVVPVNQGANSFKLLDASDGGLAFSTTSGSTWVVDQSTVNGYNTTQFYGADKKTGAYEFFGGTQDNGTWKSPSGSTSTAASSWTRELGGDGFDVAWNPARPSEIIGSVYNNSFYKTTDNGATWDDIATPNGITDGPFVTQIGRSKIDPDLIFAADPTGILRSDNFGTSWTRSMVNTADWGYNGSLHLVKIGQKNPQIVWTGGRMSATGKIQVSTDGGLTFTSTTNYTTATLGRMSGLATHPTEDSTAFALFSFASSPKVLRTTNLGQTWQDISGFGANTTSSNGFPDVAVYCLQVMPHNPSEIWVGTEIGLFISTDNGTTWAYANNGIPAVSIWQLNIVDQEVVAATFGRGIWSVNIAQIPALPAATLSPRLNSAAQAPSTGNVVLNISLRSVYDSTLIKMGNSTVATLGATTAKDSLLNFIAPAPGTVTYQIISYKGGVAYKSSSANVTVIQVSSAVTKYSNNFNSATTDFTGSLFTVSTPTGFANGALHTPHPYADNTNNTYQLKVPITVTADSCILAFDEIALVEEGTSGTVFGDAEFWDYVIVEGTSDGINWTPLADGWDARLHSQWSAAYNAGSTPTSGLFKKHTIDVLNTFNAGSTIFLRFRLFADAATTGWGWSVDNVAVNPDRVAPTLTLGALASPVVNIVRFAIGANEKLSFASLLVNSNAVTMTKQGNLYFGNYTITGPGTLTALANGADSSNNFGTAISRGYTVSLLSKSASFENYTLTGNGDGYWVLGKSVAGETPVNWHSLGAPIDVAATGTASNFKAEFNYADIEAIRAQYADFDESKIGLYERIDGEWKYAGGEGKDGKVTAAFKGTQLAVFYNPDHKFIPTDFALSQNYPNPFNPSTTIRYDIAKESKVVLKVYNMLGQEVTTLVNTTKGQGRYEIRWNGKNQFGNTVASGVYLYRLEAGNVVKTKKMLFIK
ncbi:T9SS type A sorting domain-containing protein [bacterium]|nr:T9SS type A sorting domain-containing protein [bacterium]